MASLIWKLAQNHKVTYCFALHSSPFLSLGQNFLAVTRERAAQQTRITSWRVILTEKNPCRRLNKKEQIIANCRTMTVSWTMNARSTNKTISILRWLGSTFSSLCSEKITTKSVRIVYFDREGINLETFGFTLFRDATLNYKSLKHNSTNLVSSRVETSLSIFLYLYFFVYLKLPLNPRYKKHTEAPAWSVQV